jgi:hypothetical protein
LVSALLFSFFVFFSSKIDKQLFKKDKFDRTPSRSGDEKGVQVQYMLSIPNLKIQNPKCFQVQNFLSAYMMPQVENTTSGLRL